MNHAELRAEIAKKRITNRAIAANLNISEQAFYNKLNGISEFKISEINKLASILSLSPDEVSSIFLS